MKFQMKALVAAVAFAAVLPAQAALEVPNTNGNSSMTLTVFDRVANVSMMVDLGKNYSDFNKIGSSFADSNVDALGTSFSWNLAAGDYATAWSTFLPLVNPSNLLWAVVGADSLGVGAGQVGMIGTLNQASVSVIASTVLANQTASLNTYMNNANFPGTQVFSNHQLVENGANVANTSVTQENPLNYFIGNKPANSGSVVVGQIGDSMRVFQQVSGINNTTSRTTSLIFGNEAAFQLTANGLLTYTVAPIPEADSWAMMLLGLGFMGFMARRKQA